MPQLENGYTPIANEIIEKMACSKLNGTQFRIILIVLRSTYGWKKKEHELSETFLSKATGMHKQQIKRELKALIQQGILIEVKAPTANTSRVIQFNKYYEVAKQIPGSGLDTSTGSGLDTSGGSGLDTQKRNIKNNIKNKSAKPPADENSFDYKAALAIWNHVKELGVKPSIQTNTPEALAKWSDEIRKMREIDGYGKDEIRKLYEYYTTDSFWHTEIRSGKKFREKAETLTARIIKKEGSFEC